MVKTQRLKRTLAGLLSAAVLTTAANAYSLPQLHARADDEGGSHPNYTEALALSLYFFDANQCGSGIKDGPLTWRGDCHTYDAQVSLDDVDGLSGSEKDAVKQAEGTIKKLEIRVNTDKDTVYYLVNDGRKKYELLS